MLDRPKNDLEIVLMCPALGTCVGAWAGGIPIPLDWDRVWQVSFMKTLVTQPDCANADARLTRPGQWHACSELQSVISWVHLPLWSWWDWGQCHEILTIKSVYHREFTLPKKTAHRKHHSETNSSAFLARPMTRRYALWRPTTGDRLDTFPTECVSRSTRKGHPPGNQCRKVIPSLGSVNVDHIYAVMFSKHGVQQCQSIRASQMSFEAEVCDMLEYFQPKRTYWQRIWTLDDEAWPLVLEL